jgi:hypothetical protein
MDIDKFIYNTYKIHPLLYNNGFVTTDKKNENFLKHIIEFKSFLMAYYMVRKLYEEPDELDTLLIHCVYSLNSDYILAQCGNHKIEASSFIDKSYFEQKLKYYMSDIFEYLKDDFYMPEYCYQSLINSPLSNELEVSDDNFYSRFYNGRIKHLVILLDYCYQNLEDFNRIYFNLKMDLDLTDELDEKLFEIKEKELHEQLLDKIICGLCYEINPDFRNFLRNLKV